MSEIFIPTPTQTRLSNPAGVGVLPDGGVLIVDTENHRVLRVSRYGSSVSVFAGTGESGRGLVPGDPTRTALNFPQGVGVLPDGAVLI